MKRWYALRSKARKESSAADLLASAGVEVYVPEIKVHKQHGKPPVLEPFFPGYFFGRLDGTLGQVRLASYTPGVLYIVGYGGQPWPVPDQVVESIQARLASGHAHATLVDFRSGDRLIISSGPLQDLEAIFDRYLSATGRARVLVRVLERLCRVQLPIRQLRPASKAADKT